MKPDKNTPPATESQSSKEEPKAPADALSRTPEDLEKEQVDQAAANADPNAAPDQPTEKKVSPIKRLFRKINVYLLIFILLIVVGGAVTAVNYFNSQNAAPAPNIATQELTQDALKQLANTDATVGGASQSLTIQGNVIVAGQTLMRGNLDVAGSFQTGGNIQGPSLTIAGAANLGATQINSLQVATNTAIQGSTTLRDLNVAGTASFSGAVTASQITVTKLILSGNAVLQVPNHISFTGPPPNRTIVGTSMLGAGGSVSVNGSDTSGTININTGNGANGTGCIVRINFNQAFASQPRVLVSPINEAAGKMQFYVTRNNTSFSLCTANAPDSNSVLAFDFFVTN
jgi:cytoskeletal protein CcmA (bactofilin family)